MTRIVSIGEAMVEMAPSGQENTYLRGFAGDTMNTAWYLRRLLPRNDSVDYLTAVGTDLISDQMVEFLADAGLGTHGISRLSDRTVGLYMIQLTDGERSFSYWRSQSAARMLANDPATLAQALNDADIAYFSGITIAILPEPDRLAFLDALRAVSARGGKVVFDPNLRPRLWPSTSVMTAAIMQAATVSDIVLPSHDDEVDWFGDADPEATAIRYRDAGASCVVVKNGAGPISVWDADKMHKFDPFTVAQIVDTTAAGDSFNAGFLASRISGETLEKSIYAGAGLAAKVIQKRGALVDIT